MEELKMILNETRKMENFEAENKNLSNLILAREDEIKKVYYNVYISNLIF